MNLEMRWTNETCAETCEKFTIGSQVIVNKEIGTAYQKKQITRIPAIVVERFQYFLVVRYNSGVKEAFLYKDIAQKHKIEFR